MARYAEDIFDALIADHNRHRALLKKLENTSGHSADRMHLFEELTLEVKGHASAEEQALYATILAKPETTDQGRHSVAEHKEIEDMLNHLATVDMASDEWLEKFCKLRDEYLHHIEEEEEELFPAASRVLTEQDEIRMRDVFKHRKVIEKAQAEVTPREEPEH